MTATAAVAASQAAAAAPLGTVTRAQLSDYAVSLLLRPTPSRVAASALGTSRGVAPSYWRCAPAGNGKDHPVCDATVDACLALPADLTAPATARRFTAAHCCPQHGEPLIAKALLLISELVTNAVRHGRPPITLDLQCCGTDGLLAQVGDASPHKPVVRAASTHALGGRGIALVELLANRWGVQMTTGGKTVWVRLTDTCRTPQPSS